MKNCIKKSLKSSNGITLIALVITIIVLLILAGISISMLSGDNSILQKATDAKTNTERATVIELAQTDILGQIVENKGETISETQLKTILGKYFEEINDDLPEDLSETTITLTAKEEYGGYTDIALVNIYNGKLELSDLEKLKAYFNDDNSYDENGEWLVNDAIGVNPNDITLFFGMNTPLIYKYKDVAYGFYLTWDDSRSIEVVSNIVIADATISTDSNGVVTLTTCFGTYTYLDSATQYEVFTSGAYRYIYNADGKLTAAYPPM